MDDRPIPNDFTLRSIEQIRQLVDVVDEDLRSHLSLVEFAESGWAYRAGDLSGLLRENVREFISA